MEYSNPAFEPENAPAPLPPTTSNLFATPRGHLLTMEESQSGYGGTPTLESYPTSSMPSPTAARPEQDHANMNLQDQLRVFQSMFPNQSKEHLISLIRSLQTGKTPIYPEGQSSRRDTYPAFGGDPQHTSTQSPRASPSPLEYLTPIQTQSARSMIPPTQRNPSPARSPTPIQPIAPTPSAPP